MSATLVEVTPPFRAFLGRQGIQLSGATQRLHPHAEFEAPCVIHAAIPDWHMVRVGAMTGLYGGKLGHSRVGRFCSVAPEVDVASDQHPTDWLSTSMVQYVPDVHGWDGFRAARGMPRQAPLRPFNSNSPVSIGHDVWIGARVILRSGVSIGDGAVIGAGSVVTRDVPAFHVAAGVPARLLRPRFPEAVIARMTRLRWWEHDVLSLAGLDFRDVNGALDLIEAALEAGRLPPFPARALSITALHAQWLDES
ncbi:CatB-related O-acetyltransferase [Sabulicella glaciei]|uniref:CatB-related O-acetyltransferase n=1 Tax=Sabulicella glaciei TaxID=2984948 RepID=UPI0034A08555